MSRQERADVIMKLGDIAATLRRADQIDRPRYIATSACTGPMAPATDRPGPRPARLRSCRRGDLTPNFQHAVWAESMHVFMLCGSCRCFKVRHASARAASAFAGA